jgi:hypothetical protein
MKELYQGWAKSSLEDQRCTKELLASTVRNAMNTFEDPLRTRTHRLAFYLTETFDQWTAIQDNMGMRPKAFSRFNLKQTVPIFYH